MDKQTVFAQVRKNIKAHGWHGMGVFPTDDEPLVPFNYTIGLTEKGLPELIIFGLPYQTGHQLLRLAVEDIERRGEISDGMVSDRIVKGFPCVFRELPREMATADHMIWAEAYYSGKPMRCFQIVWPDQHGRFPWHADCNETNAQNQSEIIDWRAQQQH